MSGELTELGGCFLGWANGPPLVFGAILDSYLGRLTQNCGAAGPGKGPQFMEKAMSQGIQAVPNYAPSANVAAPVCQFGEEPAPGQAQAQDPPGGKGQGGQGGPAEAHQQHAGAHQYPAQGGGQPGPPQHGGHPPPANGMNGDLQEQWNGYGAEADQYGGGPMQTS